MLLFTMSPAHAFCGTYVGAVGTTLTNQASRVAIAREGDRTTLTLAADVTGDAQDFALLLPVPEVLDAEDVRVVSEEWLDAVDAWSAPRAVAYTCADLGYGGFERRSEEASCGVGCFGGGGQDSDSGATTGTTTPTGTGGGGPAASSVQVESAFVVANYDIVVLSSEESGDLLTWLDENGYAVPAGGESILQEYIDAGVYFLAAKVHLDAEADASWLPPLQLSFTSFFFGLPIRIGTISADGPQDLVIYAVADSRVGIANYPEVSIDTDCTFQGELATWYADAVSEALEHAGWLTEHAWGLSVKCDPCTVPSAPVQAARELGYTGSTPWITRLRLRYTPEEATQDLVLYETSDDTAQIRVIVWDPRHDDTFRQCGQDAPGSDPTPDQTCVTAMDSASCGATEGGATAILLGLGALCVRRRR